MKVLAISLGMVLLVVALGSGCAGPGRAGSSASGPLLGTPVGEDAFAPREPDLGPRDRWGAPFAVSAAGSIVPLEPRTVIVLAVDPVIAAGMATQQAIELSPPERPAAAGAQVPDGGPRNSGTP